MIERVAEQGLQEDNFEVRKIAAIDQLTECHRVAATAMKDARARFDHASIVADYTGGTKSMTAGLVAAALDDKDCRLPIVDGY